MMASMRNADSSRSGGQANEVWPSCTPFATKPYDSSPRARQPGMKSSDTGDIVRYTGDLTEPLSADILAEIAALEGRPIDFSDIPPQEVGNNWYSPGALVPGENKRQITL